MSNYAIFYHPDTVRTSYEFDTTRKGTNIAAQLRSRGIAIQSPQSLSVAEAYAIHDKQYIDAVVHGEPRFLAESQGFTWDANMWSSVRAQNGAMRDATLAAITGTPAYALSAGFHHAYHDSGEGFCTVNGIALAAHTALQHNVRNVIILDVDAHCGGGTYSIVNSWPHVIHIDVYTNGFDHYVAHPPHQQYYVDDASAYLPTIQQALMDATMHLQPGDLLIHNAGIDPYEHCRIGGLKGVTKAMIAQREQMIVEWAIAHQLHRVACLAGGYHGAQFSQEELVEMHCQSVQTFLQIQGEYHANVHV